jgi:hypothetical protein
MMLSPKQNKKTSSLLNNSSCKQAMIDGGLIETRRGFQRAGSPGLLVVASGDAQLRPGGAIRHRHKAAQLLAGPEVHPPQTGYVAAVILTCT